MAKTPTVKRANVRPVSGKTDFYLTDGAQVIFNPNRPRGRHFTCMACRNNGPCKHTRAVIKERPDTDLAPIDGVEPPEEPEQENVSVDSPYHPENMPGLWHREPVLMIGPDGSMTAIPGDDPDAMEMVKKAYIKRAVVNKRRQADYDREQTALLEQRIEERDRDSRLCSDAPTSDEDD